MREEKVLLEAQFAARNQPPMDSGAICNASPMTSRVRSLISGSAFSSAIARSTRGFFAEGCRQDRLP